MKVSRFINFFRKPFGIVVLIMVALCLLVLGGFLTYYAIVTNPTYTMAEMKAFFEQGRKVVEAVPEEKLAFGKKLLALLETLPEIPRWEKYPDEAVLAREEQKWRKTVLSSGFLKDLYRLTASGPGAFAFDWASGPDALVPWVLPMREVSGLLKRELKRALQENRCGDALNIIRSVDVLARTLEHKTYEVSAIVGLGICHEMLAGILESLPANQPDSIRALMSQLARIEAELPDPAQLVALGNVCIADYLQRHDFKTQEESGFLVDLDMFQYDRVRHKALSVILTTHFDMLAAMKAPAPQAVHRIQSIAERVSLSASPDNNRLKAAIHLPAEQCILIYAGIYLRRLRLDASFKGTRIALALALFHEKTGRHPDSLKELVPSCINAIPKDPFTLKAFYYAPKGDHYILYSAGENLKDDGGKVRPFQEERFLENDSNGDLIIVRPPAPDNR